MSLVGTNGPRRRTVATPRIGKWVFRVWKRGFDLIIATMLGVVCLVAAPVIFLVNRKYNPGRLFFTQTRMGLGGRAITVVKFRSMTRTHIRSRDADEPLEHDRITPFGRILRDTHLDEVPQFANILRGDMSFVGPRPDKFDHAETFCASIVGYRERHRVKPGLTGLAQIETGYAEGVADTLRKVRADLNYIHNRSISLDMKIAWMTLLVLLGQSSGGRGVVIRARGRK